MLQFNQIYLILIICSVQLVSLTTSATIPDHLNETINVEQNSTDGEIYATIREIKDNDEVKTSNIITIEYDEGVKVADVKDIMYDGFMTEQSKSISQNENIALPTDDDYYTTEGMDNIDDCIESDTTENLVENTSTDSMEKKSSGKHIVIESETNDPTLESMEELALDDKALLVNGPTDYPSYDQLIGFERNKTVWYDRVKLFPIEFARSQQKKSTFCGQDSKKLLNDLEDFKLWAVQMYDASTKVPSGMWDGAIFDMGNFHKCIGINAYSDEATIKGKYCLIETHSKLKNSTWLKQDPFTSKYDALESAWEKIHYYGDERKIRRDTLTVALCIPSTCMEKDIINGISGDILPQPNQENLDITVKMSRYGCTLKEETTFSRGDLIFIGVTIGIIILIFVSTFWLHNEQKKCDCEFKITTFWHKIAKSFSLVENFNSLTKYRHTKPCFNVLHGVKFLCMGLVIHGHRLMQFFGKPLINNETLEETYIKMGFMIIHNGLIVLDAFFLMTGFIMAYGYLDSFSTRKSKFWLLPYSIVLRFLRLVPAYMYVVFFIATVWSKMGSGPFWNTVALLETENCAKTWWASLLLINNYVKPENMCMMTTWYLSSDFHMFVIGSIIMYIISKSIKIGYTLLGVCLIVSLVIPFMVILKNETLPILTIYPGLTDVREIEFFTNYYIKTHMRMFPYIFGLVAGVIYHKIRDTKFKIPAILSVLLFIIIETVITYVCELSGIIFFLPDRPMDPLESALYFVIQHMAFAVCTVLLIFVCSHTHASFFPAILGNKFFAILSKLTFGAYLLHYLIQIYDMATIITPISFIFTEWMTNLITDLVMSYFLAFLLFLMVEAPIKTLTGLVLKTK